MQVSSTSTGTYFAATAALAAACSVNVSATAMAARDAFRLPPTAIAIPGQLPPSAISPDPVFHVPLVSERETTQSEFAIAEIRGWHLLEANWDGEGAKQPIPSALTAAAIFVCRLPPDILVPEPMLHSSGRAGLLWNDPLAYAHLEFLGDGRAAYYIERRGDKHKGLVAFDSESMPEMLRNLLPSSGVVA